MKSLRLVDYLRNQSDKVYKLVGIFPDGTEWIKEFSLNQDFEERDTDPDNTTECFNSLCEIASKLDDLKVGESMYHQMDRDNDNYKCVIMRTE